MMRRSRSTRAEIVRREQVQAEIVAELLREGQTEVAGTILRCWHNRLFGDPRRHRPRCRSVACLSCRCPSLSSWWRAFTRWSAEQGTSSYFALPAGADELPAVSKSLRNLRDRLLRQSWLFERLAFLGLSDGQRLHVLVSHPGLTRKQIGQRLRTLWPEIVLADIPATVAFGLSPRMLARLGAGRQGSKPLRFAVMPRG